MWSCGGRHSLLGRVTGLGFKELVKVCHEMAVLERKKCLKVVGGLSRVQVSERGCFIASDNSHHEAIYSDEGMDLLPQCCDGIQLWYQRKDSDFYIHGSTALSYMYTCKQRHYQIYTRNRDFFRDFHYQIYTWNRGFSRISTWHFGKHPI